MSKLSCLQFDVALLTGENFCNKHVAREGNLPRFLKHPKGKIFERIGRHIFEKANTPANRD
jgi:hypothetical protein